MGEKLHVKNASAKRVTTLDADHRSDSEELLNMLKQIVSLHARLTAGRRARPDNLSAENDGSGPLERSPLQASLRAIENRLPEVVKRFYELLFNRLPEAKALLEGIDIGGQQKKLEGVLMTLKCSFDQVESMTPLFAALARRHVAYGVKPSQLELFKDCLLETFATVAGDAWSDEVAAEWNKICQPAFRMMKCAMEKEMKKDGVGGMKDSRR